MEIKQAGHWDHSLVKTTDGKLYVFGQNVYGKLGLGDQVNRMNPTHNDNYAFFLNNIGNVKHVSASLFTSIILTEDNISKNSIVYGMGYNGSYQFGNGLLGESSTPVSWKFTPPNPE